MELHYSQTVVAVAHLVDQLDHHMELHYSQTIAGKTSGRKQLDHHMELHYSQTCCCSGNVKRKLDHHMELHYSQTSNHRILEYDATTTSQSHIVVILSHNLVYFTTVFINNVNFFIFTP